MPNSKSFLKVWAQINAPFRRLKCAGSVSIPFWVLGLFIFAVVFTWSWPLADFLIVQASGISSGACLGCNNIWTGTNAFNGTSLTAGGSDNVDFSGAASVALPSVFVRTDTAFTMTAGKTGTFVPSATIPGLILTAGANPTGSSPGGLNIDNSGDLCESPTSTNWWCIVGTGATGAGIKYTMPTTAQTIPGLNQINTTGVAFKLNLSAATNADSFTVANIAACAPTADGQICENTSTHHLVVGSNGATVDLQSGSLSIGTPVAGGTSTAALYVDGSGNLAQAVTAGHFFKYSDANQSLCVGDGFSASTCNVILGYQSGLGYGLTFASNTVTASNPSITSDGTNLSAFAKTGGVVNIGVGSTTFMTISSTRITAAQPVKVPTYTVATLPTCNAGAEGSMTGATDLLAPAFLVAAVGSGTIHGPVYCNGTTWVAY